MRYNTNERVILFLNYNFLIIWHHNILINTCLQNNTKLRQFYVGIRSSFSYLTKVMVATVLHRQVPYGIYRRVTWRRVRDHFPWRKAQKINYAHLKMQQKGFTFSFSTLRYNHYMNFKGISWMIRNLSNFERSTYCFIKLKCKYTEAMTYACDYWR